MMSAAAANKLCLSIISKAGSAMTLKRTGATDLSFLGFVQPRATSELKDEITQDERMISMGSSELTAASWPVPIRKGDKVAHNSKTWHVEDIEEIFIAGQLVRCNLRVRG
jgi:hypothetical protein